MKHLLILLFFLVLPWSLFAQIGEHRNILSVGPTAGWNITNIKFTPKVEQKGLGGFSGGVALRYTVEKYFSTICSIQLEMNYAQLGWKEDIKDINNNPVINATTGVAENYSRTVNYIQVPFLAHLAWGKEKKGFNFFVNAGPQMGVYLSESTKSNFDFDKRNTADRVSSVAAQDTMKVEYKFDYGIAAGLGVEYTIPKVGHFLLEGRYYYGLGNIYGDSKRDYFASSNYQTISIKLSYLFDLKH